MTSGGPEYGAFKNGIPYVRLGEGKRDLLIFQGGPGNMLPRGLGFRMFVRSFRPFLETYTLHVVTRRVGLTKGYTTRDMSDDYAEMIRTAFNGHVDVIIGVSYGGLIAQHFAADHDDLFDHIVIAMAAHKISEAGRSVDYRFAELLSRGRARAAAASLADVIAPNSVLRPLMSALLWLSGPSMLVDRGSETFVEDILIEAEAELGHEATESLTRIEVPVLVLCGDEDFYFPLQYVQEMVEMIPRATFKAYAGQGHTIVTDTEFTQDVLDYVDGALE